MACAVHPKELPTRICRGQSAGENSEGPILSVKRLRVPPLHKRPARTPSELAIAMWYISKIVNDRSRRTFRSIHASGHCPLRAQMTVLSDISEPFQRGPLRARRTYPVIYAVLEQSRRYHSGQNFQSAWSGSKSNRNCERRDASERRAATHVESCTRQRQQGFSSAGRGRFPCHCLASHRSVDNIRLERFLAYKASSDFRHSDRASLDRWTPAVRAIPSENL
jgi:hypothetical protein